MPTTIVPQPCKNHPFVTKRGCDNNIEEIKKTFPEFWHTSNDGMRTGIIVKEVNAGLVHMTRVNPSDWSYTLTRIEGGLWHTYGVKYDFWGNYETQTTYYVLLGDSWEPIVAMAALKYEAKV